MTANPFFRAVVVYKPDFKFCLPCRTFTGSKTKITKLEKNLRTLCPRSFKLISHSDIIGVNKYHCTSSSVKT